MSLGASCLGVVMVFVWSQIIKMKDTRWFVFLTEENIQYFYIAYVNFVKAVQPYNKRCKCMFRVLWPEGTHHVDSGSII